MDGWMDINKLLCNPFSCDELLIFPPTEAEFVYPHLLRAETKIATDNEIQALSCLVMRHIQLDDAQRCMDANAAAQMSSWITDAEVQCHRS